MHSHKSVFIRARGQILRVDEEIAPLIKELWTASITTVKSCQEIRPGYASVTFISERHAIGFLEIVAEFENGIDTLYNRITRRWRPTGETEVLFWEYETYPDASWQLTVSDDGTSDSIKRYEECEKQIAEEGPDEDWDRITLSLAIHFPRSDLPVLIERMKRHNHMVEERELADRERRVLLNALLLDLAARRLRADPLFDDAMTTRLLAVYEQEILGARRKLKWPLEF